jgi:TPR repeat protein
VKWFLKAANQGDASAQCYLGNCYRYGWGVGTNLVDAYKWSNLGSAQGITGGATLRAALEKLMTPDQIAEAQRLSREFQPHKESAASNSK